MMPAKGRGRFTGLVKIVRFNRQFYAASLIGLLLAVVLLMSPVPRAVAIAVTCGALVAGFWTLSSLLVSWYVYDYEGVTQWEWLPKQLGTQPDHWANIHAGLDESTAKLKQLFPETTGRAIDIYDPAEMTEPSIARARRMYPATEPFLTGSADRLPAVDVEFDTVFLLFAAHEVRNSSRRTHLLRESGRVLRRNGHIVLVEHLRDWKNFVAFGPGFLHFHSSQSWHRGIRDAGLRIERETLITPFVRCFVLRRQQA